MLLAAKEVNLPAKSFLRYEIVFRDCTPTGLVKYSWTYKDRSVLPHRYVLTAGIALVFLGCGMLLLFRSRDRAKV
jgi:hypothetical protein